MTIIIRSNLELQYFSQKPGVYITSPVIYPDVNAMSRKSYSADVGYDIRIIRAAPSGIGKTLLIAVNGERANEDQHDDFGVYLPKIYTNLTDDPEHLRIQHDDAVIDFIDNEFELTDECKIFEHEFLSMHAYTNDEGAVAIDIRGEKFASLHVFANDQQEALLNLVQWTLAEAGFDLDEQVQKFDNFCIEFLQHEEIEGDN